MTGQRISQYKQSEQGTQLGECGASELGRVKEGFRWPDSVHQNIHRATRKPKNAAVEMVRGDQARMRIG